MRKVELRLKEQLHYQLIKNYVDHGGNFHSLCLRMNCSERTARRKIKGYKEHGKAFFCHGNRGRAPAAALSQELRQRIAELYRDPLYQGANFLHFREILQRDHPEIPTLSYSSLRSLLMEQQILSPKAHRSTKKKSRAQALQRANPAEPTTDLALPLSVDPHYRREKSRYAGELLFADASEHRWFASLSTYLHAAVDDAGTVCGAWFDEQETRDGYYRVMEQVLRNYGIPYRLQTDGRTIFEYAAFSRPRPEKDTATQFAYACHCLGIDLKVTSSPQAQGKIERLFQTCQSRLVTELRIHGVRTIKGANDFLRSYLPKYNEQFATPFHSIASAFEKKPSEEEINLTLALLSTRQVDTGHCIRFQNRYWGFLDHRARRVPLRNKTKVTVIEALDGQLYAACKEQVFALEEVKERKEFSYHLDPEPKQSYKKKDVYIPPMTHPWREGKYDRFQSERWDKLYNFEEICNTQEIIYR